MKQLIYMVYTVGALSTGLQLQGADEQLQASQAEEVQHLTETEEVTRAFQDLLSRMPNEGEISHYSGRVRIEGVEGMRSDLIADRRAEIVISTFQVFLSRKPTDKEITHYSSRIQPLHTTEGVAAMRSDVLADKRAERDSAASEEAATTCTQSIAEEATSTVAPAEATAVRPAPVLDLDHFLRVTGVKTDEKSPLLLENDPGQCDYDHYFSTRRAHADVPSVYVETRKIGDNEFFSFSRNHFDLSIYEYNYYSQLAIPSRTRLINKIAQAAFNGMALAEEITSQDLIEINNYTEFSPRAQVPVVIGIVSSKPFETENGQRKLVAKVILLKKSVGEFWFEWWTENCYLDTLKYPTHNVRFSVVTVSVSVVDAAKASAMIEDMKKPLIDIQTKEWGKMYDVLERDRALSAFAHPVSYEHNLRETLKKIMPKELYQYYYHYGYRDNGLRKFFKDKKEDSDRLRKTFGLPAL